MSTPLDNYPGVRLAVYTAFWVLGVVLGAAQIAYATLHAINPTWLTVGLAMYPFLGGAIGYTAAANVPDQEKK